MTLDRHQASAHARAAPSQKGKRFASVPQLCVAVQGELALLEPDLLAELAGFSLAGLPADLPGFAKEEVKLSYLIDLDRGRFKIEQSDSQYALDLDAAGAGIQRADVVRELDRRARRSNVLQADMIGWLGRVVDGLEARDIPLTYIARHIRYVSDAIVKRLKDLEKQARSSAFQDALFGGGKAKLLEHYQFSFDPAVYPARWTFAGRYTFKKHFYPIPGELKAELKREETACAIEIDQLDDVEFWVRNLERQPTSFWLPTSTDRFYPDFIAQLKDGRILVVEYKGAGFLSTDDTKEKRTIGEVWAAASGGRCLFRIVTDPASAGGKSMAEQMRAAISGISAP